MDDIWFTSDHHFGHRKILEYSNRPFESLREHDRRLTELWNKKVKTGDIVYHLGDFTLQDGHFAKQAWSKLNGQVYMLGTFFHHDHRWLPFDRKKPLFGASEFRTKDGPVYILPPMATAEPNPLSLNKDGTPGFYGPPIILCHYPIAQWDRKHYGAWHLYGHTHQVANKVVIGRFSLNVGVDAWGYSPISLRQVYDHMSACGWSPGWREFGSHRLRSTGRG